MSNKEFASGTAARRWTVGPQKMLSTFHQASSFLSFFFFLYCTVKKLLFAYTHYSLYLWPNISTLLFENCEVIFWKKLHVIVPVISHYSPLWATGVLASDMINILEKKI